MVFEKHLDLVDQHAFLSPSQPYWINDSEDELKERYLKSRASEIGTRLHQFAHDAIELNRMQPRNKDSVNAFINDAIGFKMQSEQPLYYSWWCFGTADAIVYRKNILRISDLKTGVTKPHMEQLKLYAALFCLEYQRLTSRLRREGLSDVDISERFEIHPKEIHFDPMQMDKIILRIYQFNDINEEIADPEEIRALMDTIIESDKVLRNMRMEG